MKKPKYMLPGVESSTIEWLAKAVIECAEDAETGRDGLALICREILKRIQCPSCGGTQPNPQECKDEWHIARQSD